MMTPSENTKKLILKVADYVIFPFIFVSALVMKKIRSYGLHRLPLTNATLRYVGLLPIVHHYYEPVVYAEDLRHSLDDDREILGLDLNPEGQLALLEQFSYADELRAIPMTSDDQLEYCYQNGMFGAGDSEYFYNFIRHFKPKRIVEVGAGHSTLLARRAIEENLNNDPAYKCEHIVIEPFENPWLEKLDVQVIRAQLQECELSIFENLQANDILFFDTSHVIRPQGEVLFLMFSVLGRLNDGVLIHFHDIRTPKDYIERWVLEEQRLWTEQYFIEAFLVDNPKYEVIGAVHYMWRHYPEAVGDKCPILATMPLKNPGSFWIRRLAAT